MRTAFRLTLLLAAVVSAQASDGDLTVYPRSPAATPVASRPTTPEDSTGPIVLTQAVESAPRASSPPRLESPPVRTEYGIATATPSTGGDLSTLSLEPNDATVQEFESSRPLWLRTALGDGYFRFAFIYWYANENHSNGPIITTTSTDPTSPFFKNGFNSNSPNPEYQMGVQSLLGRQIAPNAWWEVGGYWLSRYAYPGYFPAGVRQSSSLTGTTQVVDFVFFSPLSLPLSDALLLYTVENYSVESNARLRLWESPRLRVDGLAGLRYFTYYEKFDISMTKQTDKLNVHERFVAGNYMIGGQIGTEINYEVVEYITLRGVTKYGIAADFQDLSVSGPGGTNGLLTGVNNLGGASRNSSTGLAELGLSIVLRLTPNISLTGGYNAIWLDNVWRVLDQLDLVGASLKNPKLSPAAQPVWISGFTASLEFTY